VSSHAAGMWPPSRTAVSDQCTPLAMKRSGAAGSWQASWLQASGGLCRAIMRMGGTQLALLHAYRMGCSVWIVAKRW
jgi:hypothetical protein